jgi:hypothetical protein
MSLQSPSPPPNAATQEFAAPVQSQYKGRRHPLLKELPYFTRFPPLDPNFSLITERQLDEFFTRENIDPAIQAEIRADLNFMEHELLRLFRDRDHRSKLHQNRYRLYQIAYIWLAALAGTLGAAQALSIDSNPTLVPFFAFLETVIAAFVAYLATVSGREPPLPQWLGNRRAAEQLRREFFRYLTHLPPYDRLSGYRRKLTLSQRAADINRGVYPQNVASNDGGG